MNRCLPRLGLSLILIALLSVAFFGNESLVRADGPDSGLPPAPASLLVQREFLTNASPGTYVTLQLSDLPSLTTWNGSNGVIPPAAGGTGYGALAPTNHFLVSQGTQYLPRRLNANMIDPASRSGTGTTLITATLTSLMDGEILIYDLAADTWKNGSAASGAAHNLLDSTVHLDTLTGSPVAGDIIIASLTPEWTKLAIGDDHGVLASDGFLPYWTTTPVVEAIDLDNGLTLGGAATTGTILRGNGTFYVATTATYPATTTVNRILYSSADNTISEIATAASGVLITSAGGVPSIATDIPTAVTIGTAYIYRAGGTDVPVTDGGTGASTATAAFNALSPVTTRGDIIVRGATNNDRLALGSTGKILRSDGTDLVYTTATYPTTTSANRILYSSSANTIGEIATANSSVLVTDGSGVPSLSTDLPAGTTLNSLAITTLSSTTTFTNKTYDVEGSGNDFTIVDEIWLKGAVMNATGAATRGDFGWTDEATAATVVGTNQTDIDLPHMSFSASATAAAVVIYRLPSSWTGTIDLTLVWDPTAATSGDVKWQVQTAFGTAENPAFNSAQTVTTTVTAAVDHTTTFTGLDTTGAAAGEMMYILVERLGADAADTCTGVARLKGATLKIRRQL